jgi:hypothetical protein
VNVFLRACGIFNILLAVFFASQIVWTRIQGSLDTGSFVFWTILSVACLVAGIGYFLQIRWITAAGAIPVVILSLFIALASLAGGWIWGQHQETTMHFLVLGGFILAAIQAAGFLVMFLLTRHKAKRNQIHTPSS